MNVFRLFLLFIRTNDTTGCTNTEYLSFLQRTRGELQVFESGRRQEGNLTHQQQRQKQGLMVKQSPNLMKSDGKNVPDEVRIGIWPPTSYGREGQAARTRPPLHI